MLQMLLLPPPQLTRALGRLLLLLPLQSWQLQLCREMTWSQSPGHVAEAPVTAQVSGAGVGALGWEGRISGNHLETEGLR